MKLATINMIVGTLSGIKLNKITDKRANFPAPTIKITSLQTYPYTSGQKLYYY